MNLDDLVAIEEIKLLRVAYTAHFDAHELDELVKLFASDAVCDLSSRWGEPWVGQAAIRDGFSKVIDLLGEPYGAIHIITNQWVKLTGPTTAVGRCYLLDFITADDVPGLQTSGDSPLYCIAVYEDEYELRDDVWRFTHVRHPMVWPQRDRPLLLTDWP